MNNMNLKQIIFLLFTVSLIITACSGNSKKSDAYGNFETNEIIISAEQSGKLLIFNADEGAELKQGQLIGLIDTTQFDMRRQQLVASIGTIGSKIQDVDAQINVLEMQKDNILREKKRIEQLYRDSAATGKQLDDINGQLDVVNKQIIATRANLNTMNSGLLSEKQPLAKQISQIDDQIAKSYIKSPISGVVLAKYSNPGEFAVIGKPLLKIADLSTMYLRVYVSANQLPQIKIGQKVKVLYDKNEKDFDSMEGTISWISDKAEFTPKIVQTKEERINLVYAVKVEVNNKEGKIKIGMPGEVNF
jgi:HlyD family secretion protein